jgi:hypothetical protein
LAEGFKALKGRNGVKGLAGCQGGGLRAFGYVADNAVAFLPGLGVGLEAADMALASRLVGKPVKRAGWRLAVDSGLLPRCRMTTENFILRLSAPAGSGFKAGFCAETVR